MDSQTLKPTPTPPPKNNKKNDKAMNSTLVEAMADMEVDSTLAEVAVSVDAVRAFVEDVGGAPTVSDLLVRARAAPEALMASAEVVVGRGEFDCHTPRSALLFWGTLLGVRDPSGREGAAFVEGWGAAAGGPPTLDEALLGVWGALQHYFQPVPEGDVITPEAQQACRVDRPPTHFERVRAIWDMCGAAMGANDRLAWTGAFNLGLHAGLWYSCQEWPLYEVAGGREAVEKFVNLSNRLFGMRKESPSWLGWPDHAIRTHEDWLASQSNPPDLPPPPFVTLRPFPTFAPPTPSAPLSPVF